MEAKTIHIMLADINPALLSALGLILEIRLKARIVGEVFSMEKLLAETALTHPDIIILDWELPGLPKLDRISALRRVQPQVKIVVTSSRPEVAQQPLAAQADAFVSKVENPENFVRVLQAM